MTSESPIRIATTAVLTVDAATRVALYAGGDLISQQATGQGTTPIPQTLTTLRFGSTEPNGLNAAPIVLQAVYGWTSPLTDQDAALVSGNLNYSPPSGAAPLPVVSIPSALSVREGLTLQIPVNKSGSGSAQFQLRTIPQTATSGTDYTAIQQNFTMATADTVLNVALITIADTNAAEPISGETLQLELSAPVGCTLGNALSIVTITELPRISVPTTASVTEGGVASIVVSKLGGGACSVTWRTVAQTATLNVDYTGVNATTLNFADADTQKTITVQTATDAAAEGNETFNVVLENPTNCTITTATCTITIIDAGGTDVPVQTALAPAIGFASAADCGLGQPIYRVTNLNDTGAGSLRQGATAGNAMIIFEVGGRIILNSTLVFGSNITVAGETAPAPGITIQKKEFQVTASNIRISHICFERGYENSQLYWDNGDVGKIGTGSNPQPTQENGGVTNPSIWQNIHFHHCAFYWNMDEVLQHWPSQTQRIQNLSYHECVFAEPLYHPTQYDSTLHEHTKVANGIQPEHNYGTLLGYNTRTVDFQHCLWADITRRCPFVDSRTSVVVANCIANNCVKGPTIEQNLFDPTGQNRFIPLPNSFFFLLTVKGYLCISGPNTGGQWYSGLAWNTYVNPQPANTKVYASNLYGWKGGAANSTYQTPATTVGWNEAPYWLNGSTHVSCMVTTPPIEPPTPTTALSPQSIYDRALQNIGPRPKERDQSTYNKDVKRTVDRLRNKTGAFVNHENVVGGFFSPAATARALNANTTFADNTKPGAAPTATDKVAMKAWLRKFLDQVQFD